MTWGTKIFIAIVAFMGFILYLVFQVMQHDVELVKPDYYKQEIEYQQHIDKLTNTGKLTYPLKVVYKPEENQIQVIFPETQKDISGQIRMIRPSNLKLDKSFEIKNKTGIQTFSTKGMEKGHWKINVDWKHQDKEYFLEEIIMLQ